MQTVPRTEPAPRTLLRGGTVVDGTGAPPRAADVLLEGGLVAAVLDRAAAPGDRGPDPRLDAAPSPDAVVVDVTDRLVVPGFVDIHTHSDLTLLSDPRGLSKLRQGVTTEVVGNCGLGLAPAEPTGELPGLREANGYLDLDPGVAVPWRSMADYLDTLERARPALNVAALAAHIPLRWSVLGASDQTATAAQLARMQDLLAGAFDEGAVGVSTGLMYAPLVHADRRELVALAEVAADRGRLFAWHIRDYMDDLPAAAEEVIEVALATGCRVQVSHLQTVGRRNWGNARRVLAMVDEANARGADVGVDMYPYLAGNAPLAQMLPPWLPLGDGIAAALADPAVAERVAETWVDWPVTWDEIVINALPLGGDETLLGRTVADIAAVSGVRGSDVALDLLARHGGAVMMVAFGRDEADLRAVLAHPATVVASDGQALAGDGATGRGVPHPRSYGCFPRYLTDFAGDLADGVRRCTSAPADRLGLDRGRLVPGAVADIVVLDPARLSDRATYATPRTHPDGIDHVLVAGRPAEDTPGHGAVLRATPDPTGARP